ncbi:pentapeptide repeat-containing protein [Streptomyces niveus]|uniref:pentapeptide repeat-containing protein n=1 Tax=Streptomyces niveus TaxID=193462 RepID=UPI0036826C7D
MGNLGEDKMDMRLGGIYALQRIMQDSRRDQPTIANVLATYVRTHAAKPPVKGQGVPADVHAALNVLAERAPNHDDGFRPDFCHAQLPGVELNPLYDPRKSRTDLAGSVPGSGAALSYADLSSADLTGADLSDAQELTKRQVDSARVNGRTLLPDSLP